MNTKNKTTLILAIVSGLITIAIAIASLFGFSADSVIAFRIIALSITIGFSFTVLNVSIGLFFADAKKDADAQNKSTMKAFEDRSSTISNQVGLFLNHIALEKINEQIAEIKDLHKKTFFTTHLASILSDMVTHIKEGRSGSLGGEKTYYDVLTDVADAIIKDKKEAPAASTYQGEIWAVTAWMDDELDPNSNYEIAWSAKLNYMCSQGITTRRIACMSKKFALLKSEQESKDLTKLLGDLVGYTVGVQRGQSTYFIDSLTDENIAKGCFAIKLNDGSLQLVKDVPINTTTDRLLGEIVFDSKTIAKARKLWEECITTSAAKNAQEYFMKPGRISNFVKAEMIKFKIIQEENNE